MTAHTEESLRAQLEQIERLLAECGDNPYLARLKCHLMGRRDVTINEIDKLSPTEDSFIGREGNDV